MVLEKQLSLGIGCVLLLWVRTSATLCSHRDQSEQNKIVVEFWGMGEIQYSIKSGNAAVVDSGLCLGESLGGGRNLQVLSLVFSVC